MSEGARRERPGRARAMFHTGARYDRDGVDRVRGPRGLAPRIPRPEPGRPFRHPRSGRRRRPANPGALRAERRAAARPPAAAGARCSPTSAFPVAAPSLGLRAVVDTLAADRRRTFPPGRGFLYRGSAQHRPTSKHRSNARSFLQTSPTLVSTGLGPVAPSMRTGFPIR